LKRKALEILMKMNVCSRQNGKNTKFPVIFPALRELGDEQPTARILGASWWACAARHRDTSS
jgi:hypothetical protein